MAVAIVAVAVRMSSTATKSSDHVRPDLCMDIAHCGTLKLTTLAATIKFVGCTRVRQAPNKRNSNEHINHTHVLVHAVSGDPRAARDHTGDAPHVW